MAGVLFSIAALEIARGFAEHPRMLKAVSFPILCVLLAALAWSADAPATKGTAPSPAEKAKSQGKQPALVARAPVVGEAFDDREVELYIEAEGRKLLAGERIKKLSFDRRSCALRLAEPVGEKLAWPEVAARAEAATLVLGEFYREGKSKEVQFSVAAGAFVVTETGVCVTSSMWPRTAARAASWRCCGTVASLPSAKSSPPTRSTTSSFSNSTSPPT